MTELPSNHAAYWQGRGSPALSWADLSGLRWGPAEADPTPRIDADGSVHASTIAIANAQRDPYAIAEREAIRWADELLTQA